MIYTFIKNNEKIFPIEKMCKSIASWSKELLSMENQSVSERKQS
jgi:hypothetical protein